jgi:hypothetical protein
MKSFATAALIGAVSAEQSFMEFITTMAIQEAEAQKLQAAQPQFAFQELLTQMHIDEIKVFEADQVEMVEEIEANPFEILTSIAIEEPKNKKTFSGFLHEKIVEEREKPSLFDALHSMSADRRAPAVAMDDVFHQMSKERRENSKTPFMDMIHTKIVEEREKPSMVDAFHAMSLERRMTETPEPTFLDFMTGLARENVQPKGDFSGAIHKAIVEERSKESLIDALHSMSAIGR